MNNTFVFYCILAILISEFIVSTTLNYLNSKHFKDAVPEDLKDVYNEEEYQKSQSYKLTNYRFGIFTSIFSLTLILSFLIFGGFGWAMRGRLPDIMSAIKACGPETRRTNRPEPARKPRWL